MAGGQKGGAATGNLITISGHFATLTSRRSRCFAFGTSPGILRTCTYNACSLRVVTQQHYSTASFSDWTNEKGPLQARIILPTIQPRQPQQTRLSVKCGRFVFSRSIAARLSLRCVADADCSVCSHVSFRFKFTQQHTLFSHRPSRSSVI